jgi:hypothetical protein
VYVRTQSPELRAENSSDVGWYAISGEDALSDKTLDRSSSSLFTLGKMAGKGNTLASPRYFCKVSLQGNMKKGDLAKAG